MTSDSTPVAFRSDLSVELFERGVDTVLRLRPARAGSAITPTSATVTITDASGTVVVSAAAATCTAGSGMAVYTLTAATTASLALGEGWTLTWSVLLPGETVARSHRLEAALVRARLYPVVSDQDLFRRVSSLDPSNSARITKIEDYSPYLDDAWAIVQDRLVAKGDRPWLILSPASLREVHLVTTLQLVFEDLASRLNVAYADRALEYKTQARDAWTDVRFVYDRSDSGKVASADAGRKGAGGSVWLGGAPFGRPS